MLSIKFLTDSRLSATEEPLRRLAAAAISCCTDEKTASQAGVVTDGGGGVSDRGVVTGLAGDC